MASTTRQKKYNYSLKIQESKLNQFPKTPSIPHFTPVRTNCTHQEGGLKQVDIIKYLKYVSPHTKPPHNSPDKLACFTDCVIMIFFLNSFHPIFTLIYNRIQYEINILY